ncbi:MAG TPA: ornithine racemase Orr, partial [Anaerovoracaceae bacterium]|nr:ornithine racemase Orr [Anaerovoracaceae bacterium]
MYPRLTVDLKKLKENLDAVSRITKKQGGCTLMIVTKGLCADAKMAEIVLNHPEVDFIADSRIQNIKTYAGFGKETVLLRLPMASEISDVIKYVDLSFNSELETIKLLDEEAGKQGKIHKILLMIDLGDLREGIFYQDEDQILAAVEACLKLKNVRLYGLGVNLTCYGAVIPKYDNLSSLVEIARKIEKNFDLQLAMISGGNSSSIYLVGKNELPEGINNLRLGEAFLLGNDTAYGAKLPGTVSDALILEAQIIELKSKRSLPIGEIGVDAFGQKPYYEDRGIIKRAILAIGKQDTDPDSMIPLDEKIDILGASSDHLILDISKSDTDYKVGDVIKFQVGYSGMLKSATSKYVEKQYV